MLKRSSRNLLLLLWAYGQRFRVVQAQRHVHSRFKQSTADAWLVGVEHLLSARSVSPPDQPFGPIDENPREEEQKKGIIQE
jgi:hypothetical protein